MSSKLKSMLQSVIQEALHPIHQKLEKLDELQLVVSAIRTNLETVNANISGLILDVRKV